MRRLLFSLALTATLVADPSLLAQTTPSEVVLLTCSVHSTPMTVRSATRSSGAPAVAAGANCAQAIATLYDAGYRFTEVAGSRMGPTVLYTLVKTAQPAQCGDSLDNDADGFTDLADPQCTSLSDPSESS